MTHKGHANLFVNTLSVITRARMHEWLRSASGVGVAESDCCGLLQSLISYVTPCH